MVSSKFEVGIILLLKWSLFLLSILRLQMSSSEDETQYSVEEDVSKSEKGFSFVNA